MKFIKRIKLSKLLALFIISIFLCVSLQAQQQPAKKGDNKKSIKTQRLLEKLLKEAKKEVESEKKKKDGLEVDGLIFNETKTKIGQEFYDFFFTMWQAPKEAKDYTIYISEKGAGMWGSWVLVLVNEKIVYQNRLIPRNDIIEEAAKSATMTTKNFLIKFRHIQQQLEGKDMSGTGIF